MYRQIPLERLRGHDFVPQAVIGVPPRRLAEHLKLDLVTEADDLDSFEGAAVTIDEKIPVILKHYRGHPVNTITVYFPAEIILVDKITSLLNLVTQEMWIPSEWITWQRADDPDL